MGVTTFAASWIGPTGGPQNDVGVFLFRRALDLDEEPKTFPVSVSADNRYKLMVDGRVVALGPATGDLERWSYDQLDLVPFLAKGRNVISALVWNAGYARPWSQPSVRTGFLLDGDPRVATGEAWEVAPVTQWTFDPEWSESILGAAGPKERFDGRPNPDWTELPMDETIAWRPAHVIERAAPEGATFRPLWPLAPRDIPALRYVLRDGDLADGPMTITPEAPLLVDVGELVCAYPRFVLDGAAGTEVRILFAEAGYVPGGHGWDKGHRDVTDGKEWRGAVDTVILGAGKTFWEPLDWRAGRYLRFTATAPVRLLQLDLVETGYPLRVGARVSMPDEPDAAKIAEVAERTLRRCMGDTYMDTPVHERLQYVADARTQALLTYYLTDDRALPRRAVETFGRARTPEGLIVARAPSRFPVHIPPFSLHWALMRMDQRMFDRVAPAADPQDPDAIDTEALDAISAANRCDDRHWWFLDWVPEWAHGVPPGGARHTAFRLLLYLAHAATERVLDWPTEAARRRADALWGYMGAQLTTEGGYVRHRDDAEWAPSDHAEALYRLLLRRLGLPEPAWPTGDATRCTPGFLYFEHDARRWDPAALEPWRDQLRLGLTTFREMDEPSRSDCHAWSAHPLLSFYRKVAGIDSAAPGWRAARIAPDPGPYRSFSASVPHPDGLLSVELENERLRIESPVPFVLRWRDREATFDGGHHVI